MLAKHLDAYCFITSYYNDWYQSCQQLSEVRRGPCYSACHSFFSRCRYWHYNAVVTIIGASGISLSLELSRRKEDRVEDSYPTCLISLVAFSIMTLHGPEAQIMPRLVPEMSGRPEIVGVVGLISLVAGLVAWCWNGDDSTESSRQGDPSPGQDHSAEGYMAGETDVDDESDDGDTDVNEEKARLQQMVKNKLVGLFSSYDTSGSGSRSGISTTVSCSRSAVEQFVTNWSVDSRGYPLTELTSRRMVSQIRSA